jgi:hypothetical protein
VLSSRSVLRYVTLRYVTCLYVGFSTLMGYVHVFTVSGAGKLFIRKLNNNNNNNNNWAAIRKATIDDNHIRHCTHSVLRKVLDYKADLRAGIPLRTWMFFSSVCHILCR